LAVGVTLGALALLWALALSSPGAARADSSLSQSTCHNSRAGRTLASTDFEGIAIHCAQADSSSTGLCSPQNGGVADRLPGEPGGYSGFNGLFGAIYANQLTSHPGTFTPSTQDANGAANGNVNDLASPVKDV
jgi:hypothetical protein